MPRVTRTTNRLHLTDLSPTRFEDLVMQMVYRMHRWEQINHDGRTGADSGVDIRAIERLDDESLRHWFVQCRRYERATAATLKTAVDDAIEKATQPPDVLLTVVACDVSFAARSSYEEYARRAGIKTPQVWSASTLETKLYSEHPDLLFAFFGISRARQERNRETNLKRNLVMKRRLSRMFKADDRGKEIIVHSVDDDTYPGVDPSTEGISGWFKVEYGGSYHNGLEVILRVQRIAIERATNRWALIEYDLSKGVASVDSERFATPKVFRVGRIPFRNIVEIDEEGDEYYPGPHLYCAYADAGQPYETIVFKLTDDGYMLEKELQMPTIISSNGPLPT